MSQEEYIALINEIKSFPFKSIQINTNNIEHVISMYESFTSKKLIPITYFNKNLKKLEINTPCIHCKKNAIYYNVDNDKETLCWSHSHSI
jgi:hypothetical protein